MGVNLEVIFRKSKLFWTCLFHLTKQNNLLCQSKHSEENIPCQEVVFFCTAVDMRMRYQICCIDYQICVIRINLNSNDGIL